MWKYPELEYENDSAKAAVKKKSRVVSIAENWRQLKFRMQREGKLSYAVLRALTACLNSSSLALCRHPLAHQTYAKADSSFQNIQVEK